MYIERYGSRVTISMSRRAMFGIVAWDVCQTITILALIVLLVTR